MKIGFNVTARRVICGVLSALSLFSATVPAFATNGGGSTATNGSTNSLAAVSESAEAGTTDNATDNSYKPYMNYTINSWGRKVVSPTREELFRDLYSVSKQAQMGRFNDDDHMYVYYGGKGYRDRYIAENFRGDGIFIEVGPFITVPNAAIAGIEDIPYADLLDSELPFHDRGEITRAMSADFRVLYTKYGDDVLVIHDYYAMKIRVVVRGGDPKGQTFERVMPETVSLYAGNGDSVLFLYKDYGTGGNSKYRVFRLGDDKISELFGDERITGYYYDEFQNTAQVRVAVKTNDGWDFEMLSRDPEALFSETLSDGSLRIHDLHGTTLATVSAEENLAHEYPMTQYGIYGRVRGINCYSWN